MDYREWKERTVIDGTRGIVWGRAAALLIDPGGVPRYAAVQPLSWGEAPRVFRAESLQAAGGRLLSPGDRGLTGPALAGALACTDLTLLTGCPLLRSDGGIAGEAAGFLLDGTARRIEAIRTRQGDTLPARTAAVWGRDAILLAGEGAPIPPEDAPVPPEETPADPPAPVSALVTTYIDSGEQAVIPRPGEGKAPLPAEGSGVPAPPGLLGARVAADVRDEAGRLIARRDDRVTEGMLAQARQAGRMAALLAAVRS